MHELCKKRAYFSIFSQIIDAADLRENGRSMAKAEGAAGSRAAP
jgi:hypothetical protein